MHKKRHKFCTCYRVSLFYLYHSTKIAKAGPGFDDRPEHPSVQINSSSPWYIVWKYLVEMKEAPLEINWTNCVWESCNSVLLLCRLQAAFNAIWGELALNCGENLGGTIPFPPGNRGAKASKGTFQVISLWMCDSLIV